MSSQTKIAPQTSPGVLPHQNETHFHSIQDFILQHSRHSSPKLNGLPERAVTPIGIHKTISTPLIPSPQSPTILATPPHTGPSLSPSNLTTHRSTSMPLMNERWAGGAFENSPSPDRLPLPSFVSKGNIGSPPAGAFEQSNTIAAPIPLSLNTTEQLLIPVLSPASSPSSSPNSPPTETLVTPVNSAPSKPRYDHSHNSFYNKSPKYYKGNNSTKTRRQLNFTPNKNKTSRPRSNNNRKNYSRTGRIDPGYTV